MSAGAIDQAAALRRQVALLAGASRVHAVPEATRPAPKNPAARVIAVASGKGGVGKTTIAVNLSALLARAGLRVCLVDADLGVANADILCGLQPRRRLGPGVTMRSAALRTPGGFDLVPGPVGVDARQDESSLADLVDGVSELAAARDVVVVDLGAGVGGFVTGMMAAADETLLVATPEPTSVADAYALVKCAVARLGGPGPLEGRVGLVMNEADDHRAPPPARDRLMLACQRFLRLGLLDRGVIRRDLRVGRAVCARTPLVLGRHAGPAARDLARLASALLSGLGPTAGGAVRRTERRGTISSEGLRS